jgi:hypothetical protein
MPYIHIVMLKFKAGTSEEDAARVTGRFLSLKESIAEILSIECGVHEGDPAKCKGFTHYFRLTFAGEKEKDAYVANPLHKEFSAYFSQFKEDSLVFDYTEKD